MAGKTEPVNYRTSGTYLNALVKDLTAPTAAIVTSG